MKYVWCVVVLLAYIQHLRGYERNVTCQAKMCLKEWKPVCGTNSRTYWNKQYLTNHNCKKNEKVTIRHNDICYAKFGANFFKPLDSALSNEQKATVDTKTILQIAHMIGVSPQHIVKQYNINSGLLYYLNETSLNDVAKCFTLSRSNQSIKSMFDVILKAEVSPMDRIRKRIMEFRNFGFNLVDNYLLPTNNSVYSSLHKFCTLLPNLYERAYDPYLLSAIAKSHGNTSLEDYKKFLKAFNIEKSMKNGILAYYEKDTINLTKSKEMVKESIIKFYTNINVTMVARKLSLNEQDVKKLTLVEMTARYENVSTALVYYLYLSGGVSTQIYKVAEKMSLGELFHAFGNSSLVNMSLGHTFLQIAKSGNYISMLGSHPLVSVAAMNGVIGVQNISTYTLMQMSTTASKLPEKFFLAWFNINEMAATQMRSKISKIFKLYYNGTSPIDLQHLSLYQLSSRDIVGQDAVKKEYMKGLHWIYKHVEFGHVRSMYGMTDADVQALPVIKLLEKYQGLDKESAKKLFSMNAFSILNTFSPIQMLMSSTIQANWTFSRINKTLQEKYGELRSKTFLNIQMLSIPHFCDVDAEDSKDMSFHDLSMKCVGLSLTKEELGLSGDVLRSAAQKSLGGIMKVFSNDDKIKKHLMYLNMRKLATLSKIPKSKVFLNRLSDILVDGINTTTVTLGMVVGEHLISNDTVEKALNGWLGNEKYVKGVFAMSISNILLTLNVDLKTLTNFTIDDIMTSTISKMDSNQAAFLPFAPSKLMCNESKMSSTLMKINSCFESIYIKLLDTKISGKFTPAEVNALSGSSHNVNLMDFFSLSSSLSSSLTEIRKKARTPLVLLAHEKGISIEKLIDDNLVLTSVSIFGFKEKVLQKVFSIPDSVMNQASTYSLRMLHELENSIDNVKQVYTVPLITTFDVVSGRLEGKHAKNYELPKAIKLISTKTLSTISKIYKSSLDSSYIRSITLVKLAEELFGVTDIFFKDMALNMEQLKMLNETKIGDVAHFKVPEGKRFEDIQLSKLTELILDLPSSDLRKMLLQTVKTLVNNTDEGFGTIRDLFKGSKSGADLTEFISLTMKAVNVDKNSKPDAYMEKLLSFNLTRLPMKVMNERFMTAIAHIMLPKNCLLSACNNRWEPQCAADKKTYVNKCHLQKEICMQNKTMQVGGNCLEGFPNSFFVMPLDSVIPQQYKKDIDTKTLFQVATIVGVSTERLINHYHIEGELLAYLSTTSLNDVAQCFTLLRFSQSLKHMFDEVLKNDAYPTERIYARMTVFHVLGFTSVNKYLPPANSSAYFKLHKFCTLLPNLYERAYDPYLLSAVAKSHGNTSLEDYRKFLKAFNIEKSMKGAALAYFKNDAMNRLYFASVIKNQTIQFYNGINLTLVGEKLRLTKQDLLCLTLTQMTAKYALVEHTLVFYLYLSGGISINFYTVAANVRLMELNSTFKGSILFDMPLSSLFTKIQKFGDKAVTTGYTPAVLAAHPVGIIGLKNIMELNLMDLSTRSTSMSEKFIVSWFMISEKDVQRMKTQSLGHLLKSEAPYKSFSMNALQHLSLYEISSRAFKSHDDVTKGFVKGLFVVFKYVEFQWMPPIYAMSDSDVNSMTVLKLLDKYLGLKSELAKNIFARSTYDLFNLYTPNELISKGSINKSWTISKINDTIKTTPKTCQAKMCLKEWKPVCGTNSRTYWNKQYLTNHNCEKDEKVTVRHNDICYDKFGANFFKPLDSALSNEQKATVDTKTILQIAHMIGVSPQHIVKQYSINSSLLYYLNETSLNDVAKCFTLSRSIQSIKSMFDAILKAEISPMDRIRKRIMEFQDFEFTLVDNYLPPSNHSVYSSLHKFCTLLPNLYERAYDPYLLSAIAKSHGNTSLEDYKKFLKAFNIEKSMKNGILAYFEKDTINLTKSKEMVNESIIKFYTNINVTMVARKLSLNEQDVKKLTLVEMTARYENVSAALVYYLYLSGGVSTQIYKVAEKMSLGELFHAFGNSSLVNMSLGHTFLQIAKSGNYISMLGSHPLVSVAAMNGVIGVQNISTYTLMQMSTTASKLPEKFFLAWFNINEMAATQMRSKISKIFKLYYNGTSPIDLQHLSLYQLSSRDIVGQDAVKKEYMKGLHWIYKHVEFGHVRSMYGMTDADVQALPVIKLLEKYQGLDKESAKKLFSMNAFSILNTFSPIQMLMSSTIQANWTFSRINKTLQEKYGELRSKTFLNIQMLSIPHFCDVDAEDSKDMSFHDLSMKCVGLSLTKEELGLSGDVLRSAAQKSLGGIMKVFSNDDKIKKHLMYLNMRKLATLSKIPKSKVFLNRLSDILVDGINTTTVTLGMVVGEHLISNDTVEKALNGWLGNEKYVKGVFAMSISNILLTLNVDLKTLTNFTIDDIMTSTISKMDSNQAAFLPFAPSKLMCNESKMSSTLMKINSCFESIYIKLLDTKISGKFTPAEVNALSGSSHNVNLMDFFSLSSSLSSSLTEIRKKARTPLVLLAHEKGISIEKLIDDNLVLTSVSIFGFKEKVLQKVFSIPDSVMNQASTYSLRMLHELENSIDNVKQVYTVPLITTFDVVSGRLEGKHAKNYELPEAIKLISNKTLSTISKIYKSTDSSYIRSITLVKLAEELFGVTDIFFKDMALNMEQLKMLNETKIGDVAHFKVPEGKRFEDIQLSKLTELILDLPSSDLRKMLLQTVKTLVNNTDEEFGTIRDLFKGSKSGADLTEFISLTMKAVNVDKNSKPDAYMEKLLSFNLTRLPMKVMNERFMTAIAHIMLPKNCLLSACNNRWEPQCAADKKTYVNKCHLQKEICMQNKTMQVGGDCLEGFPNSFFVMPLDSVIPQQYKKDIDTKTLFQVATIVGVSTERLINHYHIEGELLAYLSTTSLNDVAQCFTLLRFSQSLKHMFDEVLKNDAYPTERIYARMTVFHVLGFTSVNKYLPPANSSAYFKLHKFCTLLPNLYERAYDPYLLSAVAKSHGNTSLEDYRKFLKAFNIEKSMKGAALAYFKNDAMNRLYFASVIKNQTIQFYNVINLTLVGEKLRLTKQDLLCLTLTQMTAKYALVEHTLVFYLYLSGGISINFYTVAANVRLMELNSTFKGSILFDMPLSSLFTKIQKFGDKAVTTGYTPAVLAAHPVGIIGLKNIMELNLMDLSTRSTSMSEKFIVSWFMISEKDVQRMKTQSLGHLLKSEAPYKSFSMNALQHLSLYEISSRAFKSHDDVTKGFVKGLFVVFKYVEFQWMPPIYAMSDSDVNSMTVLKLLDKYLGLKSELAKNIFARSTYDLFNLYTPNELISKGSINKSWTISKINDTIKTTPKTCQAKMCLKEWKPVCGTNSRTYWNKQYLTNHNCEKDEKVTVRHNDICYDKFGANFFKPLDSALSNEQKATVDTKTILQIAHMIGVSPQHIVKQYSINSSLLYYLNETSLNDVAKCFTLSRSIQSIKSMFDAILKAEISPMDRIRKRIMEFQDFEFTLVDNYLPPSNHSVYSSLHKFCTLLPNLYERAYDPYLLSAIAKSHGNTSLEDYKKFLKAFNIEKSMKNGILAYYEKDTINLTKSKEMVKESIIKFYTNINVTMVARKLSLNEQDVKKLTLVEMTARYENVSAALVYYLYLSGGVSTQIYKVAEKMSLGELFHAFGNSSLVNMSLGHTFLQIAKSGNYISMLGSHPLVSVAAMNGVIGVQNISTYTLMQMSTTASKLPEKFFLAWFNINEMAATQMRSKISKIFKLYYNGTSPIDLQHLSLYQLSSRDIVGQDAVKKEYMKGLHWIYKHVEFGHVRSMYGMTDADVQALPVIKLLEKYQGLDKESAKKLFSMNAFSILNTFSPIQMLMSSAIQANWTFSRINKTLQEKYGELRSKTFLNIQMLSIPHFCDVDAEDSKDMSFHDLSMKCVGLSLTKEELGLSGDVLRSAAQKSLGGIMKVFSNDDKIKKHLMYLNMRKLATLSKIPKSKVFLNRLSDILVDGINTTTVTLGMVVGEHLISNDTVEEALNGWLGNEKYVKGVFAMSISNILLTLNVDLKTLTNFTIDDIMTSTISKMDSNQAAFLPFAPSKLLCNESKLSSTLMKINSCFESIYIKLLDTKISGKFTPAEVNALSGSSHNVNLMDFFSLSSSLSSSLTEIQKKARTPLVLLAHEKGISIEKLIDDNLVLTSVSIFGFKEKVLQKVFSIPDSVMNQASTYSLRMLHELENSIDNVKQVYTVPLITTLDVVSGRLEGKHAKNYELPKAIKLISTKTLSTISKIYKSSLDSSYIRSITLVKLAEELFGVTDIFFKDMALNMEQLKMLNETKIGDVAHFKVPEGKRFEDIQLSKLTELILDLPSSDLRKMLLQTVKTLVNNTDEGFGTIRDLFKGSKSGADLTEFISLTMKAVNVDKNSKPDAYMEKLLSFNLTRLPMKVMNERFMTAIAHIMLPKNCLLSACNNRWEPQCAADKKTYVNKCHLQKEICMQNKTMQVGGNCLEGFPNSFFVMPLDSVIPQQYKKDIDTKTLFQVATIVGVSTERLINHYHIEGELLAYLSTTLLNDVAQCFTLLRFSQSLKHMFDEVLKNDAYPTERIYARMTVFHVLGFTSVNKYLPPANSSAYFKLHKFCTILPNLYERAYDPYLLSAVAKSHGNTSLEDYRKFLKAFNIEKSMKGAVLAYFKNDAMNRLYFASVIKNQTIQFYNGINLTLVGEKLRLTKQDLLCLTLTQMTAKYALVEHTLVFYLYLSGGISINFYTVAANVRLMELNSTFKESILFDMPFSSLFTKIQKFGDKAVTTGYTPAVLAAHTVGIIGLKNIMELNLMDLSTRSTSMSEKFIVSWFMISEKDVQRMKTQSLGHLLKSEAPYKSFSMNALQHLSLYEISSRAFKSHDDVTKGFVKGLFVVFKYVEFQRMPPIYAMSDSDVNSMTVLKLLDKYLGLKSELAKNIFARSTYDLFNLYTPNELISKGSINKSWTISKINDTIKTSPRMDVFTNMQLLAIPHFCKQNASSNSWSLDEVAKRCVGYTLQELKSVLGLVGNSFSNSGNKSLVDIKKEFAEDSDILKKLDYLNLKQITTLSNMANVSVFLKPLRAITIPLNPAAFKEKTFVDLLKNGSVFSTDEVINDILGSWLGKQEYVESVYQQKLGNIAAELKRNLTSLFDMNFNDIFAVTVAKSDPQYGPFLRFQPSKILCKRREFNSTLREISSCFNSTYTKYVNLSIAGKFTPNEFNLITYNKHEFGMLDFFSVSVIIQTAVERIVKIAHTPLILLAHRKGIDIQKLTNDSLVVTSQSIFGFNEVILQSVFNIPDNIMKQASTYSLRMLHELENSIDNVKQVYTVPLITTFDVVSGRLEGKHAKNYELPKAIKAISALNFTVLAAIYSKDMSYFNTTNLVSLAEELFGIDEHVYKVAFNVSKHLHLLRNRTIQEIILFSYYAKPPIRSLSVASPRLLTRFITNFRSFNLQELLLTTPEMLLNSSGIGAKNTTLAALLLNNKYGVKMEEFQDFVKETFVHFYYLPAGKFATHLMSYNLNKLPTSALQSKLLLVLDIIGRDLQFDDYLMFNLNQWKDTDQMCVKSSMSSCTLKTLLEKHHKSLKKEASRLGINPKYLDGIGETDLLQYRQLLGLTDKELSSETLSRIFTRISEEYEKIDKKLHQQTIIQEFDKEGLDVNKLSNKAFQNVFYNTTNTTLTRLQYHKDFKGKYNSSFIDQINNQTLQGLKNFVYLNEHTIGMTAPAIVLLPWYHVIKFFTGGVSLEVVNKKRLMTALNYRHNVSISHILKMYKMSKEFVKSKSILFISMHLFGLNETMTQAYGNLTGEEFSLLKRSTVEDIMWIYPDVDYFNLTTVNAEMMVKDNEFSMVFTSSLSHLRKRNISGEFDHKNASLLAIISHYGKVNKTMLKNMIFRGMNSSRMDMTSSSYDRFKKYIEMKNFGDYSSSFKKNGTLLNSLKIKDLLIQTYDDLNNCDMNSTYCQLIDLNSACVNTTMAHECKCNSGFKPKDTMCNDINECDSNPCNATSICVNTDGNYMCMCRTGYIKNETHGCVDMNECDMSSTCDARVNCTNTEGSFTCGDCPEGLAGNGTICEDMCKATPCPGESKCVNSYFGPSCQCKDGYFFDPISRQCKLGKSITKLKGIKFKKTYIAAYANKTTKAFVDIATKIEQKMLQIFHLSGRVSVISVQVSEITRGSIVVDLNVIENTTTTTNTTAEIKKTVEDGIAGGSLDSLNVDVNSSIVGEKTDICKLGTHNCDTHATCVTTATAFECQCKDGYVMKNKNCTKKTVDDDDDDDNELLVAILLPVFVVIVILVFVLAIYCSRRSERVKYKPGSESQFQNGSYEME
ncbi:uncharacterized protein LOC130622201 [Hydractinia symbiolongicarpus]|uniref:uncharacterized protein LOC130622201 n=1 Tax=Hydractinia symbiolongicarpus TaxID=13093 RepID=UPI00254E32D0|nr:uncharacterized protein LOC130622201 [Hydractinia symbiolongicarpus]